MSRAGRSTAGLGPEPDDTGRGLLRDAALAGPGSGIWPLAESGRAGVLAGLAGPGAIAAALAAAGHADERVRLLPGAVTMQVLLGLCLFCGQGYDRVLAKVLPVAGPLGAASTVPTASALSAARARLGEAPVRALFEQAAAAGPPAPVGSFAFGLELTAFDGTTLECGPGAELLAQFGAPTGAARGMARVVTLVSVGTRRVAAAAIGSFHASEQELADRLAGSLAPGTLNLADRNFYSMRRWLTFAATGAHLLWRVKNDDRKFSGRVLTVLPDGSMLIRLRESPWMRNKRRRDLGDPTAPGLPDTVARLVEFDVTVTAAGGRTRVSRIRVLTTLLDHQAFPAEAICACYAERWQVEIAYLRIKKTLRGAGIRLRGTTPETARQEIWALLTVYNTLCDLAAQAAALEGIDPDEISFTTVLRIVRDRHSAPRTDTCHHCGHQQTTTTPNLTRQIANAPRNRTGRQRHSPRTPAERRTQHGSNATYTITIVASTLPKADN
jgi:hypothetical protein